MTNNSRVSEAVAIADFCWRVVMRAVFWIAYAVAVLTWAMFILAAYLMPPEASILDRIVLAVYGGVPIVIIRLAERLTSRRKCELSSDSLSYPPT